MPPRRAVGERGSYVSLPLFRSLDRLSGELQLTFFYVRAVADRVARVPSIRRFQRLSGWSEERAVAALAALLREGFLQDVWLGPYIVIAGEPLALISIRRLRVLEASGLGVDDIAVFLRVLLLVPEDGIMPFSHETVAELLGLERGKVKSVLAKARARKVLVRYRLAETLI